MNTPKKLLLGGLLAVSALSLTGCAPPYTGTAAVAHKEQNEALLLVGKVLVPHTYWELTLCPQGETPVQESAGECFDYEVAEDEFPQFDIGEVVQFADGEIVR